MSAAQFADDYELVAEAVLEARHIQEFIWDKESLSRKAYDPLVWAKVFQKRVDAIGSLDLSRPHADVELRKRLLQQAALSIKALVVLKQIGTEREGGDGRRAMSSAVKDHTDSMLCGCVGLF